MNNLVQTGYQATEPNHIGTQNPRREKNTTPTAKNHVREASGRSLPAVRF